MVSPQQLLSEFLGTFALISAVVLNVAGGSDLGVTSIAFTLMVCIYALGDVSGANFNPAVSMTLGLAGKLPISTMLAYIVAQCLGGSAAGLASGVLVRQGYKDSEAWPKLVHDHMPQALGCEMMYTAMLCLVVACVAATKQTQGNQYYGLAIGLVIVAGGHATGQTSGGCLNPAVALGVFASESLVLLSTKGASVGSLVWLLGGELLGAVLGFVFYRLLHPEETLASEDVVEGAESPPMSKCVAEFLGTFYLVLTVGLNVLHGEKLAAWSIAAALAAMVYAVGSVSGGHLNPAVTIALAVRGRGTPLAGAYIGAQVLGGVSGAELAVLLGPQKDLILQPQGPHFGLLDASVAELFSTLLLCLVVLCIATVPGKDVGNMVGLAVGSCVTAGGFAIGPISGGSLNPAVSVALACTSHQIKAFTHTLPVYVSSEIFGGVLAAAIFFAMHRGGSDEEKPLVEQDPKDAERGGYDATEISRD